MQQLQHYANQRLPCPAPRRIKEHPDVPLLAHMTCFVAGFDYARTGQLTSRNKCFLVVLEYIRDELWPLNTHVPARFQARTVFLGKGRFRDGSLRRWVADIHGEILIQRFEEAAGARRSINHDRRARDVHAAADRHLKNLIAEVAKLAVQDPANTPLLNRLHQLHAEVI